MSAPQKKKQESSGSPAWMATFADLMSLLMCFFVLLLSFSEMDLQKYKQVAGSMKMAFGIQRKIKSDGTPKGTSIIAREYSPGRPQPTIMQVITQEAVDNDKQSLDFTDVKTESKESDDIYEEGQGGSPFDNESQSEAMYRNNEVTGEGVDKALAQYEKEATAESDSDSVATSGLDQSETEAEAEKEAAQDDSGFAEKIEKTVADATKLIQAMEEEIKKGMIHIETQGQRILVRIKEKGSFASGSADFQDGFLPVLEKLRTALIDVPGKLLVAGHTDNVPINTARFRSNWELSSSRAVSVVHELLKEKTLDHSRFLVEGHGDAHPLVSNDSRENRAINRRVELTIVQGDGTDDTAEETFEGIVNQALENQLELVEITETEPVEEQNPFENTAEPAEEVALIPEVSIDTLDEIDTSKLEMAEQIPPEPITEDIKTTNSLAQPELNKNSLEERIRRFTERMEKTKKTMK